MRKTKRNLGSSQSLSTVEQNIPKGFINEAWRISIDNGGSDSKLRKSMRKLVVANDGFVRFPMKVMDQKGLLISVLDLGHNTLQEVMLELQNGIYEVAFDGRGLKSNRFYILRFRSHSIEKWQSFRIIQEARKL